MVMNKILFFTLSLVMAITAYGQNSASVDTLPVSYTHLTLPTKLHYRLLVTLHPSVHMRNSLLQGKKAM